MSKYLIGGACAGLGADLVRSLAHNSEHELFLMTRSASKLQEFLCSLGTGLKARCHIIEIDFAYPETIAERLAKCPCAEIDFFVYLISVVVPTSATEISSDLNQRVININYISFVECVRCLLGAKPKERPLKVIVLSALESSYESGCSNTIFAASKAAINTYVRQVAHEMRQQSSTINAIAPVFFSDPIPNSDDIQIFGTPFHMQVLGYIKPREMIATIEFLLKNDSYNGVILPINSSLN